MENTKEKAVAVTTALENIQDKEDKPKGKGKARESVRFQLPCGAGFVLSGKVAKTLRALIKAGSDGVTSLTISGTWALRTSHYIWVLRHKWGIDVQTVREKHKSGWHGRYVLLSKVKLMPDIG